MHSVAKIALGLALSGGIVGGIAWWEHGAFDRLCERGAKGPLTEAEWTTLTEHLEDPKIMPAVATELSSASGGETCKDSFKRADDHVGTILARQKTSDDVSLQAIAHMMTRCNEPKLLAWTSRPTADLLKTIHDREIASLHSAPENVLPDMLLRLQPKVDQTLVDIVIASTKPAPSSVDAFWTNGFPPDGADFTSSGPSVPPLADPRQTHGIAQWLWSLQAPGAYGIQPEAAAAMLRILDHVTPPKLDDKIARCLGLADGKDPDAIKVCRRLVTAADKDLLDKGMPNATDRDGCMSVIADRVTAQKELAVSGPTDAKIAALIALGAKATPALRDALLDKDPATRRIAEKVLAVVDRHQFALGIAKSFRAGIANARDAEETSMLLSDPPLELDAWFSLFSLGNDATTNTAVAYIKDKVKPEDWVPGLFAGLTPQENAAAMNGYTTILTTSDKIAPIVAAVLSHALAAAGTPDLVDPRTKLLALRSLSASGTPKEVFAIEPFVADTTSYEQKPFSALATQALAAAKAR